MIDGIRGVFTTAEKMYRPQCVLVHGVRVAVENLQSEEQFTLWTWAAKVCWNRLATAETGFALHGTITA